MQKHAYIYIMKYKILHEILYKFFELIIFVK